MALYSNIGGFKKTVGDLDRTVRDYEATGTSYTVTDYVYPIPVPAYPGPNLTGDFLEVAPEPYTPVYTAIPLPEQTATPTPVTTTSTPVVPTTEPVVTPPQVAIGSRNWLIPLFSALAIAITEDSLIVPKNVGFGASVAALYFMLKKQKNG